MQNERRGRTIAPRARLKGIRGIGRLQQVDLVEEIVQEMRSRIVAGQFGQDGELPTEAQLSQSFGVSRTVSREAMRTLRAQGLVAVSRGRRPRVCPVDPQVAIGGLQTLVLRSDVSVRHLFEIRRLLELEIAHIAAQRATEHDCDALQTAIDDQQRAQSVAKQMECDRRFHEVLARATGNVLFSMLLGTVAPLLDASRKTTLSRVGPGRAVEGHTAILASLRARDPQAARRAMELHLKMAEEDLGESLPGANSPRDAKS